MPRTDLTTRPIRPSFRVPLVATVVALVVVGLAIVLFVGRAIRTPSFVGEVTLVNPTPYGVEVDLRRDDDDGRLLLGRAEPEDDTVQREVTDIGGRWLFRFTHAGVRVGELDVSRDALERDDWRVTVPDSVTAQLRGAGVPPDPQPRDQ
jgi:hypothetical protein